MEKHSNIYSTLSNILIKTQDYVTHIRQKRTTCHFVILVFEAQGVVSTFEAQGVVSTFEEP